MKTGATVCFVMAAITFVIGVKNIVEASQERPFERLVGYGVGSMLPALALLVTGLILQKKAKKAETPPR